MSAALARALAEQHRSHVRIVHVDLRGRLDADRKSTLDCGARTDGFKPALEMRELRQILALPLGEPYPADAGHVSDRVAASQKLLLGKPRVHDAIEAVHFVSVASDGVRDLLGGITPEMGCLPRHRPESADLPEQPFLDGSARPLLARIELAALASEILQDGA